jgi:hypothetical protein
MTEFLMLLQCKKDLKNEYLNVGWTRNSENGADSVHPGRL